MGVSIVSDLGRPPSWTNVLRVVDELTGKPRHEVLGRLAEFVRDRRFPLEHRPIANVDTGV